MSHLDLQSGGPRNSRREPEKRFDVFVSHSNHNKREADVVCSKLEAGGIRCWIAPRDILPGTEWAEGILDGIDQSRIMVLIFSEFANSSPQVKREVERAIHKQLVLIPFRVENTLPTRALEYCLSTTHWLDAFDPPLEQHTERLLAAVRKLLDQTPMDYDAQSDARHGAGCSTPNRIFAPAHVGIGTRPLSRVILGIGALLAVIVAGFAIYKGTAPSLGGAAKKQNESASGQAPEGKVKNEQVPPEFPDPKDPVGTKQALKKHIALLEEGKRRIALFPDYSATYIKQERIDGDDLQDLQSIRLKLRQKPFGVYMKWIEGGDVGREVLYAEGQYDDKMLVRLAGIKSGRLPILKLDLTGSLALKESRHPVTEMGIALLADQLLKYRQRDLALDAGVQCEMLPEQKFMDRRCACWVIEYDSREIEPVYRKSITYIDKEMVLPIAVMHFGWPDPGAETTGAPDLDESTLIEHYGYVDLDFESGLTDRDFDKDNSSYGFRRK